MMTRECHRGYALAMAGRPGIFIAHPGPIVQWGNLCYNVLAGARYTLLKEAMVLQSLLLVFKGIIYGVTNLLPGIGGGIILLILGIYEQFVEAVGNFFLDLKRWKEHLAFLIPVGIGAAIGMIVFAKGVTIILERYPAPTMFFFMGLVLGTVPSVLKMHEDMRLTWKRFLAFLLGLGLVVAFRFAERQGLQAGWAREASGPGGILYFLGSNFIAGGASVTPGLDGSYIWILSGVFEPVMAALSALAHLEFHWATLITTGIGAVAGIILFSKVIDTALKRIPAPTYYGVLGLILGSVYGLWPDNWLANGVLLPILVFAVGCVLGFLSSRSEKG